MINLSDVDAGDTNCNAWFLDTINKNLRRTDTFIYKQYLAQPWSGETSEVLQKFDSNQGI